MDGCDQKKRQGETMKSKKPHLLGVPLEYQLDQAGEQSPPTALEKDLMRFILKGLGNPAIGVTLWDGEPLSPTQKGPTMVLRERAALWRLLTHPTLHFGDDYSAGRIEIEGGLLNFLGRIYDAFYHRPTSVAALQRIAGIYHRMRGNPVDQARDNIYHHYDIGNDFYKLWLDDDMVYTCGYFAPGITTLEAAQQAKMEHVCRKLRLTRGETVIEAGCGWGSLARYMARHYGVKVRAFNISHEQIAYARDRAKAEGLDGLVEYVEDDYRNISRNIGRDRCDVFVSVGMLEHVGVKHYRELGAIINNTLKPDGRGLIHTIGQNQPIATNAWVYQRIFPGGYTPTLREMMNIFEPYDLSVLDVENLRLHYARTLEHWQQRFENQLDTVRSMYDESFVRAWRLYLVGSIANFTGGYLQLFQVLFSRSTANTLPVTRDDIYRQGDGNGAV
jgi:cyclopropane-fatty-acyl-phospholipid synthase